MLTLLLWVLGLLVLFFLAVYLNELVARYRAAQRYPMPGRLVDVGGHRLHIHAIGEGEPTVVLAVGLGESALTWADLQPQKMQHWPAPTLFAAPTPASYPFGNLPLLVMTATKDPEAKSPADTNRWIAHHAGLTKLSTAGRQMLVDCGHHILHEQPALVVGAIRDLRAGILRENEG